MQNVLQSFVLPILVLAHFGPWCRIMELFGERENLGAHQTLSALLFFVPGASLCRQCNERVRLELKEDALVIHNGDQALSLPGRRSWYDRGNTELWGGVPHSNRLERERPSF
jgi:hypothetical protein